MIILYDYIYYYDYNDLFPRQNVGVYPLVSYPLRCCATNYINSSSRFLKQTI